NAARGGYRLALIRENLGTPSCPRWQCSQVRKTWAIHPLSPMRSRRMDHLARSTEYERSCGGCAMNTAAPSLSPSLSDFAAKINTEFAANQKAEQDTNKSIVQRAIGFGRTLCQAKEKVGHGKWEKWLNDNCRDISVRTAQRYMKLADSPEVRAELGKNDTVSLLS